MTLASHRPLAERQETVRIVALAAPVIGVDAAYAAWPDRNDALLWDPRRGYAVTACGAAAIVQSRGVDRVGELLVGSRRLWSTVSVTGDPAPSPRLWGGLAFAPGTARADGWHDFGDALFVLPKYAYWRDGDKAWLHVAGTQGEPALHEQAGRICDALSRAETRCERRSQPLASVGLESADVERWRKQVADILAAIASGEVGKVVAARCTKVAFAGAPCSAGVLRNLRKEAFNAWRFGFSRRGSTFVGATPEMLIARCGAVIESEALAGTRGKFAGRAEELLASVKDRDEHRFVLQGIMDALQPLCAVLEAPPEPGLRELRDLFHLASTIRGRLRERVHVLELCERLHPTPATGGTPRKAAVARILASEAVPRGWYGAPVGWFDAAGDGEFVVALRSGLVSGGHAYVYAGAGIVSRSDADEELAETQLKQRLMLRALGVPT